MNHNNSTQIQQFLEREKFVAADWLDRGLTPPDGAMRLELVTRLNSCARNLQTAYENNSSKTNLHFILKRGIEEFNDLYLDTESKELIVEYFYTLASLGNIDFANDISVWLYGINLTTLPTKNVEKILDALEQNCHGCESVLKTAVIGKKKGVPALWLIVKCTKCNTHNLLSLPAEVKAFNVENYIIVEQLQKDQYTEEEAKVQFNRYALRY